MRRTLTSDTIRSMPLLMLPTLGLLAVGAGIAIHIEEVG